MRDAILGKLRKLLHVAPTNNNDVINFLKQATKLGILEANILGMLEGVIAMQDTRVADVMVPRMQMITLDYDMDLNTIMPKVVESGHSRFPVLGENKDEVLGIILAKDLLNYNLTSNDNKFNIHEILRTVVFIPESKRLHVLLQDFRINRNHMAMVVDEYGRITGLITIEDVLEQIVGDIADEYDIDEAPAIRANTNDGYTVKALTSVEEFNDFFAANLDAENVETIGGLVTRTFGHMPKRGESINIKEFVFTVARADNRRIHILHVKRL